MVVLHCKLMSNNQILDLVYFIGRGCGQNGRLFQTIGYITLS